MMLARLRLDRMSRPENDNRSADREESVGSTAGWLGITMQNISSALASALVLANTDGVLIANTAPGGPADNAGLVVGTVITGYNGQKIKNMRDLARELAGSPPGRKTMLDVIRGGKPATVSVTVGQARGNREDISCVAPRCEAGRLGLTLSGLPDATRLELRIPRSGAGTVVVDVAPDGIADRSGIRIGDVVMRVDEVEVHDPIDASNAFKRAESLHKTAVAILVSRAGQNRFIGATLEG
jgi:serine protease Do